ncbi:hypothetical protein [Streptomyces griseocarneus]|nr:hypothetical protein [Streptomyces griseocarneus]MBZ6476480.1 hypothetical protein [Streptomyces griseocarneus]
MDLHHVRRLLFLVVASGSALRPRFNYLAFLGLAAAICCYKRTHKLTM